jgi:hypothetical protein
LPIDSSEVPGGVKVMEDNSFFDDFSVDDDKVNLDCEIELENTFDSEVSFRLIGVFDEDEGKLLKEGKLSAVNKETSSTVFTLKPAERKCFEVVFEGDYAGTFEKQSRRSPKILVDVISET